MKWQLQVLALHATRQRPLHLCHQRTCVGFTRNCDGDGVRLRTNVHANSATNVILGRCTVQCWRGAASATTAAGSLCRGWRHVVEDGSCTFRRLVGLCCMARNERDRATPRHRCVDAGRGRDLDRLRELQLLCSMEAAVWVRSSGSSLRCWGASSLGGEPTKRVLLLNPVGARAFKQARIDVFGTVPNRCKRLYWFWPVFSF